MMDLLLLSAGWGTRLRPLTFYRPKALIPVRGKPCLETCYDALNEVFTIGSIWVNTHALSPWFFRFFEKSPFRNWRLLYEPEILGSGGTVMHCMNSSKARWLMVVNSDTFLPSQKIEWLSGLEPEPGAVVIVVSSKSGLNNVVVNNEGRVIRFRSKELTSREQDLGYRLVAFAGIHLLDKKAAESISWCGDYADIINLYAPLLKQGRIRAVECPPSAWHDIGNIRRYFDAHTSEGARSFWAGSQVVIEPGCSVEKVILWDGVVVRTGSRLRSCIVTDGVEVSGVFESAVITPSAVIPIGRGEFCRYLP
ncbi:sugar phosphate nucleotidyltransferase [Thermodesulforhabdus norvegica]|uniref:NDP-sugar pyrophosphorylase, includes eIF-2Bgamma, eIF-2Bepsilon, and LPS biosynthesis proteins n=1 Tax=Thermodesulforhabdus norvegica TaxID=39841 RepID=A0A1I4QIR9_9BACT|nr:sugar phosphate nucleotidyltransferase [Thermodesulforhabdus norvegica]SFM40012.1 NDP-sugar pyrophosphorylase, includes eIF-2Bgamma, eIF-2Bepsilon, and LPS biosynthesis proteins [Thermodesulforhabdus norvegica]